MTETFRISPLFSRYNGESNTLNIRGYSNEDVVIASTLRIPNTPNKAGYNASNITVDNANAMIQLKDRNDGLYRDIYVDDSDLYIIPAGSGTARKFVRNDDIDNIIDNPNDPRFSNVFLTSTGYINWYTNEADLTDVSTFIGFRNNGGVIQFRNNGGNWLNVGSGGVGSGTFVDLTDTVMDIDNIATKPYLKWQTDTTKIINVALEIADDTSPQLGGALDTNEFNILIDNGNGIADNTGNLVLGINNANTHSNYLEATTYLTDSSEYIPTIRSINPAGSGTVSMRLATQSNGDLDIDVGTGDVNITAANISLNSLTAMNFNSGYIKSSITTYQNVNLSTNPAAPQTLSPGTDLMILQISGDDGRFYGKLDAGSVSGQNLNIVYETSGSNNHVELTFYDSGDGDATKKVGVGNGLASKLTYTKAGQSSMLVYLEFDGYTGATATARNRWQVLNTGTSVTA